MKPLESHLRAQIDTHASFFWHRLRWDAVAAVLPAGPFRLLDVGAGAGILGQYLTARRPEAEYCFVEPLESLERHLAERFGAERNRRGRESWRDADVVTLLDVLEHQADDRAYLADLRTRLRPGCTLVLTVPALPALWSRWDEALGHHRRYTRASLREALAGAGFEVRAVRYLFPELVPAGLVRRWRSRRAAPAAGEAEFPLLPPALNAALYWTGRVSLALAPVVPLGTSLFAVARKGAED